MICKLYLNKVDMCFYINIYTQLEKLLYLRFENNTKRKIGGLDSTYRLLFILKKAPKCLKARNSDFGKYILGKTKPEADDMKPSKARHFSGSKGLAHRPTRPGPRWSWSGRKWSLHSPVVPPFPGSDLMSHMCV